MDRVAGYSEDCLAAALPAVVGPVRKVGLKVKAVHRARLIPKVAVVPAKGIGRAKVVRVKADRVRAVLVKVVPVVEVHAGAGRVAVTSISIRSSG